MKMIHRKRNEISEYKYIYIYSFTILFLNYSDCSDKTDVVKIIIIFTISNIFLLYFIHYTNDIIINATVFFLSL